MLNAFNKWRKDDKAAVAIEVGFLMPVMLLMLMGVMDVGTALYVDQKLVDADQMMADLLTRYKSLTAANVDNVYKAGELTMEPYVTLDPSQSETGDTSVDPSPLGADIVGIQYDPTTGSPTVKWRETWHMTQNTDINPDGLGSANEGIIVVTAMYKYTPFFTGVLTGSSYTMEETAYARGRNGQYISEGS